MPDVRNNAQPFSGRIYVLLLDDYHVGALRSAQVKKAAHAFIDRISAPTTSPPSSTPAAGSTPPRNSPATRAC